MLKPYQRHCLVAFLVDCAVLASYAAMPFFVYHKLHGGAYMSGVVAASQTAAYGVVSLLSATFVNRARNGLALAAAGIVFFGVAYNLAPLAHTPWVYTLIASAGFAGLGLVWPALHSWLGGESDLAVRRKRIVAFNVSWSLGLAAGPLFGGPLYDLHYLYPFAFSLVLCFGAAALTLSLPHERAFFAPAPPHDALRISHDRASEEHLYYAWLANWLGQGLMAVVRSILPKRVETLVNEDSLTVLWQGAMPNLTAGAATQYSWVAFSASIAGAAAFLVLGFTHRWQHRFVYVVAVQVAAGAALFVLGVTKSLALMAVCAAVIGGSTGACFFAAVYYSLANPRLKHSRAAINEAAVGLGGCAGSLVFGQLSKTFGVSGSLLLGPPIVAAVLVLEAVLFAHRRASLRGVMK